MCRFPKQYLYIIVFYESSITSDFKYDRSEQSGEEIPSLRYFTKSGGGNSEDTQLKVLLTVTDNPYKTLEVAADNIKVNI